MRRFGQILHVRPEFQDEYVRQHEAVWPGVLAQIHRSNIRNYSIFLRDGILFAYFEYVGSDFAAELLFVSPSLLSLESVPFLRLLDFRGPRRLHPAEQGVDGRLKSVDLRLGDFLLSVKERLCALGLP